MPGSFSSRLFTATKAQIRLFLLSLGFLTRLAPGMRASTAEMGASVSYYPLAGAFLGLALILPFSLGLGAGSPWTQAWLYAFLSAWLTRALHLDGLADILDALGSGKQGEGFQAVLKDSRTGAFGVAGICLALSGQIIFAAACFSSHTLPPLAFAPVFGRCLPIFLAFLAPCNPKAGLGALLAAAPGRTARLIAAGFILAGGLLCLPPAAFLASLVLTLPLLLFLRRIALREQGFNGDFFGFLIICGELIVLACAVTFPPFTDSVAAL